MDILKVASPNTVYSREYIQSNYSYETTRVESENGQLVAIPERKEYTFRVQRKVKCQCVSLFLYLLLALHWIDNGNSLNSECSPIRIRGRVFLRGLLFKKKKKIFWQTCFYPTAGKDIHHVTYNNYNQTTGAEAGSYAGWVGREQRLHCNGSTDC